MSTPATTRTVGPTFLSFTPPAVVQIAVDFGPMRIGYSCRTSSLKPVFFFILLCFSACAAYIIYTLGLPSFVSRGSRLFGPLGDFRHHEGVHSRGFLSTQPHRKILRHTLGVFSEIFVISRPSRLDRRATMERLRQSLALNWTIIDAISPDDPLLERIVGCVRLFRQQSSRRVFEWPPDLNASFSETSVTDLLSRMRPSVLSTPCDAPFSINQGGVFPLTGSADSRIPGGPSSPFSQPSAPLSYQPSPTPLTCAVTNHSDGVNFEPSLPAYMLLTSPKLACWYSHLRAIARFASRVDDLRGPALFLEDDVDMERDIGRRLDVLWHVLPSDWDIVFLGM